MIVFDDLHGADSSSLLLLEFVARTLRNTPVLILGTCRDTAVDIQRPLTEAILELLCEPRTERIGLSGLRKILTENTAQTCLRARS